MASCATHRLDSVAATESLGRSVAALLRPGDSILLEGPLGAGKTTFARALLRAACGAPSMEVPSPSYTLAQSYEAPGFLLTHFDLWRLAGPDDVLELGWEEARAGIVLVEWPDRLGDLAPADALWLRLEASGETGRIARLTGWEGRPRPTLGEVP